MSADEPDGRRPRSPASRMLGAGARGAGRLAGATGVDRALEDAAEEAIVRALRSPAVERAIVRALSEGTAIQRGVEEALSSDEVADAVVRALDTEVADRVWMEILASPKAQMLVERIAEAPEVRAAIAQQGVGLVTDLGRRLTILTERLDDAIEQLVQRIRRRATHETETTEVGIATRGVAAVIDLALITIVLSISSGLLASVIPAISGGSNGLSVWGVVTLSLTGVIIGGAIFVAFWSLVGQTPGMRLLSIRLDVDGSREVGLRRAIRRILVVPLSILVLGLGYLNIVVSPRRRGWHDAAAGTTVVYDHRDLTAPWAKLPVAKR
jgi:uncharacterized RDD family membrane protein YckC